MPAAAGRKPLRLPPALRITQPRDREYPHLGANGLVRARVSRPSESASVTRVKLGLP